jgi:hypothetical protein
MTSPGNWLRYEFDSLGHKPSVCVTTMTLQNAIDLTRRHFEVEGPGGRYPAYKWIGRL